MEKSVQKISKLARQLLGSENVRTIVEIGAKDCVETMGFSANFPKAQIYAFECNPATLPACRKRVASVKNVTLIEKAVSDKNGEVTFFPIDQEKTETPWADGNPGASSLLIASGKYKKEKYVQNEIRVQSTTLASFLAEKQIESVDFLWMDIQGAELMALQSAGDALAKIKIIHTEVEFMEIYQNQPLFADIKKYLNEHGFLLYGFTYFGRYFGDAVFVKHTVPVAGLVWRDKLLYPFYKYFWIYVMFVLRLPAKPFRGFAGNVQP